jgi:hypothetical protein
MKRSVQKSRIIRLQSKCIMLEALIFLSQPFRILPTCSQKVSRVFVISFDHTQAHTTIGRTPLEEGSARRRDIYLRNTLKGFDYGV